MIVKTHRTSLVRTLADRVAAHPRIQTAVIGAVQSVLPGVVEELLWEMAPEGDYLRIYKPKRGKAVDGISARQRSAARDERIEAALKRGEATFVIARRETVSERHVFRIKARIVATVE